MGANKEKQNIRFKKTSERLNKSVRFDGFNKDEINLIKTKQKFDQFDKELNIFWSNAPRKENGSVDWDSLNNEQLEYFDYIFKQHEKLNNKLSKFDDNGLNADKIMNVFMLLNVRSASF